MFKNYSRDRCYIIAEIGGNFISFDEAKRMIDAAHDCSVDAVKLQTYRADTISSKEAIFDMENTGIISQRELFKKYEVGKELHREVFTYAQSLGLDWFSTPSHESDVDLLEELNVGAHKIGSDDTANLPFLRYVARTGKPVLLSTGMSTMSEVHEAVDTILAEGNQQLILLHAITSYPTHPEHVNLGAMEAMIREFPGLDVGYSDHTLSPAACLCAVAMGARVIERHFTYDKNADGPDHMLSADPREMKWLVDAVRTFEVMRGSGVKCPANSEKRTRLNNCKSIIVAREMKAGERITRNDIAVKRPGFGIQPKFFDQVIGRCLAEGKKMDSVLQWDDLA